MPQTAFQPVPGALINQIRNLPRTGPILGDIFDGISRSMLDLDTRMRAIKPTVAGAVATTAAGEATASYFDDPNIVPFDGATARSQDLRAGDYVSVLDFGADPTGAADSAAAINAAIAAVQTGLGTKSLYIPWGTYKIATTILLGGTVPVNIVGAPGSKLLRAATLALGNPILRVNVADCSIRDLILQSNDVADTLGIHVQKAGLLLSNVSIRLFGKCIYTDANSHGLVLNDSTIEQRAAATLPPILLTSTNACIFMRNVFAVETEAAIYEAGTSDGNYCPSTMNYLVGGTVLLSPAASSTSTLISAAIVIQDSDPFAPDPKSIVLTFDQEKFKVISRNGATSVTQLEINAATNLATFKDLAADLLTTPIAMIGNMLGIADGYVAAEGNAIPDTVALLRFRPADNALDVSVESSAGVRVWKQLFPLQLPPTAENVASISHTVEYQNNENGIPVKWRVTGTITYGSNRSTIRYHRAHLIGPAIGGVDPLMNQEFAYFDAPPPAPETSDYETSWFDLPTDANVQYNIAVYVYDVNDTLTPSPTETGYFAIDQAAAPLNIADFGLTAIVAYPDSASWAVDFEVTLPVDRSNIQAIVPKMQMAAAPGDDPWIQDLGDQDVPATGPAVFRCGTGDWGRPDADETHVIKLYIRDIYNREIGPIDQNITVAAFSFSNISSITLTQDTGDFPGFARYTGSATIPSVSADPDFAGVRVYGHVGDHTGITFDDLFIVADVDHEPQSPGPITFDFTLERPVADGALRLYFASKHQDAYDIVRFSGPAITPTKDFTIPAAAAVQDPPGAISSLSTITLSGTDPLKRLLNATANVPSPANGFDGCFVWKMVGSDGPYLLGFAHHPVGTGSPFTVEIEIDLPETAETGAVIYFQEHSKFGLTNELVLSGGSASVHGTVDIPARPTDVSAAPLADAMTSVSATVGYRPGQFRFIITGVFPTPRTSIKYIEPRIVGPYISGTPNRTQSNGMQVPPASGDFTHTTGWFDLDTAAQTYKIDIVTYNEDNIPTFPATISADISVNDGDAPTSGDGLITSLALTRLATRYNAEGVELCEIKATFNNPTDDRVYAIEATVRTSTQTTDEEQSVGIDILDNAADYGAANDWKFGPWPASSETIVCSFYSIDGNGNRNGPVTSSIVITLGAGSLNLGRAGSGFDTSRFEVIANQFKVKASGIKLADLDTLNIQVGNFAGNLDVSRVLNLNTLAISSFSGNLDISRVANVNTINIDNLSGALNASKITNLGALNIGAMSGSITISSISNLSSFNIASFSGVLLTSQLAAGILNDLTKFSDALRPITKVSSLPGLPNIAYPVNTVVLNGLDSRLYRNVSNVWVQVTASDTISGKIVSGDILSVNAGVINGLITAVQIQNVNANQINGTIQSNQIGTIQGSQIANIVAGSITIGQITDSQIATVSASKLTVGTVNVTVTLNSPVINSPNINVIGSGFNVNINTTVGVQVTGTFSGWTTTVNGSGVTVSYPSSGQACYIGASSVQVNVTGSGSVEMLASFGIAAVRVRNTSGQGFEMNASALTNSINGAGVNMGGSNQYVCAQQYRSSNITDLPGGLGLAGLTAFKYVPVHDQFGNFIGKMLLV